MTFSASHFSILITAILSASAIVKIVAVQYLPYLLFLKWKTCWCRICLTTETTHLDLKQVLDTVGDAIYYVPVTEFARAVAGGQRSNRRNLVYFFDHYPAFIAGGRLGTLHGVDLFYEFDLSLSEIGNASLWNAEDEHLRQKFMAIIAGFVKTGWDSRQDNDSCTRHRISITRHFKPLFSNRWFIYI